MLSDFPFLDSCADMLRSGRDFLAAVYDRPAQDVNADLAHMVLRELYLLGDPEWVDERVPGLNLALARNNHTDLLLRLCAGGVVATVTERNYAPQIVVLSWCAELAQCYEAQAPLPEFEYAYPLDEGGS